MATAGINTKEITVDKSEQSSSEAESENLLGAENHLGHNQENQQYQANNYNPYPPNMARQGYSEAEGEPLLGEEHHAEPPPSYTEAFPPAKHHHGYQQYQATNNYNPYPPNMASTGYQTQAPMNNPVIYTQPGTIPVNVLIERPPIEDIDDHCGFSVFACFCCCWIIGCFAICASLETQNAKQNGEYERARSSSRRALVLARVSVVIGLFVIALNLVLRFGFNVYNTN